MVLALLAFLAGLLPALRFALPPLPFLIVTLLAAAVATHRVERRRRNRRPGVDDGLLLIAFLSVGAAAGGLGAARAAGDCRLAIPGGAEVTVSGALEAGAGPRAGEGSAPLLPIGSARVVWNDGACRTRIRVRLPETLDGARAGTRVYVTGRWLESPPPPVRSAWPARLFPRHDAMAEALLLGRRERMDTGLRETFARAGLVHLLAISGTHVGLLAAVVLVLGAAARLSRRQLTWVTLAAIWCYLAMIGAPASAVRAGLMLSLALISVLIQRPAAALPMIAAAALALLVLDPLNILDPGFQLSFLGVGGILVMHRTVHPLVPGAWKRRPAVRWVLESTLVSVAAFAATAPVTAHHFGSVAPVAIAANLPALPLMSLALVGVLAATVLESVVPSLARLCADGAGLAFDLLTALRPWPPSFLSAT
jgi:ComEC/Rec2-related protein